MWRVLFHLAGTGLHSLFPFFAFQTFSGGDIISITNKVNAVTVIWDTTKKLLQVLCLQLTEGAASKMLVTLDECHGIHYHYNRLVIWWQSIQFCPRAAKRGLDCSHVVGLVPYPHSKGSDLDQTEMLGNSSTHDCKPPPSCHQSPAQSTFSDSCTRSLLLKSSWL